MKYKMNSKNPFRNFMKNVRRITILDCTDNEKVEYYNQFYTFIKNSLKENEAYLNNSTAYSSYCEHWNEDKTIASIRPVSSKKNPWLMFKREFEEALQQSNSKNVVKSVSTSLAWFYHNPYLNDWIVD